MRSYEMCQQMKVTKAFSLIELMVVVAIVGILSSVAMPTYTNYVIRAKVASSLELVDPIKTNVMEEHSYGTVLGTTNNVVIVGSSDSVKPAYVTQILQSDYGCAEIDYDLTQLNLSSSSGQELSLMICPQQNTTTNMVTWNCGYSTSSTASYAQYLPQNCQQEVTQDTTM